MLDYFTLSSDAEVRIEDGEQILMGDPTETSLVVASLAFNQTKKRLIRKNILMSMKFHLILHVN